MIIDYLNRTQKNDSRCKIFDFCLCYPAWVSGPRVGSGRRCRQGGISVELWACHGVDAKGKGPLADQLKVAPADLTQLAKKNGGVFPTNAVYEKVDGRQEIKAHGPREMPVWGYQYMPLPIAPNQPFGPKALSQNREIVIRGRILSLIDYLHRMQEK